MKQFFLLFVIAFNSVGALGQTDANAQKIYETEKNFARAVAERGVNQAFLEFSAPDGTCFFPGYPVNCREYFKAQPASAAALSWNPTYVDVASNGIFAYTTGSSIYRPAGKDDQNAVYGQYLTVWQRQPDGSYKAVLDGGISHPKPATVESEWKPLNNVSKELNEQKSSAADSVNVFFETATRSGMSAAYKNYAADDVRALREGSLPITGKKNLLSEVKKSKERIAFAKRSMFFGAADMAYTANSYTATKSDNSIEKGNFVQIWKLRGGKWQLVMDAFMPAPEKK